MCWGFCKSNRGGALIVAAVGMWESRPPLARFPRSSWKEGEACFWLSTLSTAPAFPRLCALLTAEGHFKSATATTASMHSAISTSRRSVDAWHQAIGSALATAVKTSPSSPAASTNRRAIAVRHSLTRRCRVRSCPPAEWHRRLVLQPLEQRLGRRIGCSLSHS